MQHANSVGIILATTALALASNCSQAADAETKQPTVRTGVVGIQLRERGALLIEEFKGDTIDEKKWRIWHSDPEAVDFSVRGGRFEIRGRGHLQPSFPEYCTTVIRPEFKRRRNRGLSC